MKRIADLIRCRNCHSHQLTEYEDSVVCNECNDTIAIQNGVLIMSEDNVTLNDRVNEKFWGKHWEDSNESSAITVSNEMEHINRNLVPFIKDKAVLDAGCGNGRLMKALLHAEPALLICTDISDAVFDAKALYDAMQSERQVVFMKANSKNIPLRDGIVDTYFSFGVVHHIDDQKVVIAEAIRTARSDILIFLQDPGQIVGRVYEYANIIKVVTNRLPYPVIKIMADVLGGVTYACFRFLLYTRLIKLLPPFSRFADGMKDFPLSRYVLGIRDLLITPECTTKPQEYYEGILEHYPDMKIVLNTSVFGVWKQLNYHIGS